MEPCNGKKNDCHNAVWVRSGKKIDLSKLSYEDLQKFRKSGKKLPEGVTTTETPKQSKRRVRL